MTRDILIVSDTHGRVTRLNELIEYRQKLYSPQKIMQMMEKSFEKEMGIREKTLADYRKEFKIVKGDGFYQITGYKSENPAVIIPGKIKDIPVKIGAAFEYKFDIQTVHIDEGVTEIEQYAFRGCENLQSITIPESVTNISESAFRSCPNVTIHASAGSYAEQYAKRNNIKFQAI